MTATSRHTPECLRCLAQESLTEVAARAIVADLEREFPGRFGADRCDAGDGWHLTLQPEPSPESTR